jgi:hypothetical protein
MKDIVKIIAYYSGIQIDYYETTYFPNGQINEGEGVPAILELEDKGGWKVIFSEGSDNFQLLNASKILSKINFKSIVSEEIEVRDTTGNSGRLHLNGKIVESKHDLTVNNASKVIVNDWSKIGVKDPYEMIVVSEKPPYEIEVAFRDGRTEKYDSVKDVIILIDELR